MCSSDARMRIVIFSAMHKCEAQESLFISTIYKTQQIPTAAGREGSPVDQSHVPHSKILGSEFASDSRLITFQDYHRQN